MASLRRTSVVVLALALVTTVVGFAQQAAQQAPDRYVVLTYMKVLPGQEDAYREFLKSSSKKVYQELMATDPSLLSWSSGQVMYQGLESAPVDYVSGTVYSGAPPDPGANLDDVFRKALGTTQAEAMKKLASMRTVVGTEILRGIAAAGSPDSVKEGDYRVGAMLKVKPGMGDEWIEFTRTMQQPMIAARIANGELKTWGAWGRVFPSGTDTKFDALSTSVFKDLASALKGTDGTKTAEIFAKTHPSKSFGTYSNNMRDYAEVVGRRITRIVVTVDRTAPAGTKTSE